MPSQAGIQYVQALVKKYKRREYWIIRFRG
jgi:hypothetical protein